jgi:CO dehydrogenase/acetyl-CoA synthase epsilon subunit
MMNDKRPLLINGKKSKTHEEMLEATIKKTAKTCLDVMKANGIKPDKTDEEMLKLYEDEVREGRIDNFWLVVDYPSPYDVAVHGLDPTQPKNYIYKLTLDEMTAEERKTV